jgi:hypothetical protein
VHRLAPLIFALAVACDDKDTDTAWNFDDGEGCLSCHVGIEKAHPEIAYGECTICHGGDGLALTKEDAHIAIPDDYLEIRGSGLPAAPFGYIKDMPPDMLDQLDPDYIRFINPGDIRAAEFACGECHPEQVANVPNSVMTTNAGHYMPSRYYAGIQGQDAIYGSHPAIDPDWDGAVGTVEELVTLPAPSEVDFAIALESLEDGDDSVVEQVAYDHYLSKNCNTCHAAGYPKNNSRATYRSTGCTSCHMVYSSEGVYEGNDAVIPNNVPVYPIKHELTNAIPTEQCATCHYQGGRIGLLFRGIREGGFTTVPENAEVWAESVYTHTAGYYILDEDTTNSTDETPADIHYQRGMHCVDCHVGSDVHGDGAIYSTSKYQVDLRCEDCHGGVREAQSPDSDDAYYTSTGRELTQLFTNSDGEVALMGRVDEQEHIAPQVATLLEERGESSYMHMAMGPNSEGWSHTDSLTCDTCHNSWQQHCLGCHVTLDMRLSQTDYQTGIKTAGLTTGSRDAYALDKIILCQAQDGRAQSCNSSQQVQMSVVDGDGELVFGSREQDEDGEETGGYLGWFRTNEDNEHIRGWAPFYQHTATDQPRGCIDCHRSGDSDEEWARVKGVYGHGFGENLLATPDGTEVDPLQFLDEDGNQTTLFVHEGTGPLSPEVRERALGVDLSE